MFSPFSLASSPPILTYRFFPERVLDAAQDADGADLGAALAELFAPYSQARQHAFDKELRVLEVDLSPLPTSKHAQGSERGYLGRSRSKTGRKLVRVRAAATFLPDTS